MLGSLRACLALGLLVGATAAAADSRPAVIELFTSQGCSSCPPADALLGELARRPGVLALSFHVKYWDELGWRDRFAIDAAAQRQTGYSRILGHSSVYTPQGILDGRSDFVGSDRGGIEAGLRGERTGVPVSLTTGDGELMVRLGGGRCLAPSDVLLVTYLRKAVSAIGRGENSGRTLQEFNVVRSIRAVGHWNGSPSSFRVSLSSLPGDATDVALLVQIPGPGAGPGQIIGAASHALP